MRWLTGVFAAVLVLVFAVPPAQAFDSTKYQKLAEDSVRKILTGNVDVDALMKTQETLIKLGAEGCREHAKMMPKDAKIMNLVVDNADKMKTLKLDEIEDYWHEGGVLEENGIDFYGMDHMGPTITIMYTVVHPATAYIALKEYKKTKDKDYLDRAKDELTEVLEHIDFIKKHLEEMKH